MVMYELPDYIVYIGGGIAFISTFLLILVGGTSMKIPYYFTLLMASMRKKPLYFVHQLNSSMRPYYTKRKNGDENTLDLPSYYGSKFVPDSAAGENYGLMKAYHGFEKSALAHNPVYSAAITSFMNKLKEHGVPANVNVIDALFYAEMKPENMICVPTVYKNDVGDLVKGYKQVQIDEETFTKLLAVKADVQNAVVENGLIIYDKVQEFLQYSEFQSAQNLDEAKSILYKKATVESINPNNKKDMMNTIIMFLMAGVVIIILGKMAGLL